MIAGYLRRALWPHALVFNYGWPAPLTLPDVLPYAILVTALLGLAVFALVRRPFWGFLGAWFFVTLAPTSSVIPIATEVAPLEAFYAAGAEHQDYYRRNVRQYFSYNAGCGRAERLKQIWGKPDR